jgi:hypothetical protein
MDQQQDLAVLGYGALASGQHDFTYVQGHAGIELLFSVERLIAGVADEIIGHPQVTDILSYRLAEPYQRSDRSKGQSPKPAGCAAGFNAHLQCSCWLL